MPSTKVMHRIESRIGLAPRPGPAVARQEMLHFIRRLAFLIAFLLGLVLAGTTALVIFENVSFWFGFQEAVDTIATIGAIGRPHTLGGQITQLILIPLGLGTMFYVLVTLTELFVAGDLSGLLEARRMESKIAQLKDHFLICGFGRVGRQVARDMQEAGVPFVVVDDNPDIREAAAEMGVLLVEGRGSDDHVMTEAGIERSQGLIACVDSDAENIFATLTARQLRPDIHIVARAAEEPSESKLLAAGANDVISPYKASGQAMAQLALDSDRGRQIGLGPAPGRSVTVSGEASSSAKPSPSK
jgi:voltage-gated potassium channel